MSAWLGGPTVVDEERNVWVGDDVGGLARGRVGGHDDDGRVGVGRGGEVGVVHQRHVGHVIRACGQMKLFRKSSRSAPFSSQPWTMVRLGPYKASIFKALNHLRGQSARLALVRVALGRLVVQRDLVHGVCWLLYRSSRDMQPLPSTRCDVRRSAAFSAAGDLPDNPISRCSTRRRGSLGAATSSTLAPNVGEGKEDGPRLVMPGCPLGEYQRRYGAPPQACKYRQMRRPRVTSALQLEVLLSCRGYKRLLAGGSIQLLTD